MNSATITLGGVEYQAAPLRSLQVAGFYDAIDAAGEHETKTAMMRRTMRTIAQSLRNAGVEQLADLDDDAAINWLDSNAAFREVDPAFAKVLELSGLQKAPEGEAPAAGSTSNGSSAAS